MSSVVRATSGKTSRPALPLASGRARNISRHVQCHIAHPGFPEPLIEQGADVKPQGCALVNPSFGSEYFTSEDQRPIILFDGKCNLCNGGIQFVLDWDSEGIYRFAALQSVAGQALLQRSGRRAEDISSIVLVTKDRHWIKSQAVLCIASQLNAPFPVLQAVLQPFPAFVRDSVYEWVSEHRYQIFGESDACRLMRPEWRDRFLL